MERRAIVDDPVGAGGEKIVVSGCSAKSEDASAGGFARTRAGGSVFDDDAELRVQVQGGSTFPIGLGVGLTAGNVAGGNEVLDVWPHAGGTKADFGERTGGRRDDGELRRENGGKEFFRAGERDNIVDVFDFGAFHPVVFGQMDGRIGVGEEFLDGGEASATVGAQDGVVGVEVVLAGPACPDAGNGGSGIDKDTVHVEQ